MEEAYRESLFGDAAEHQVSLQVGWRGNCWSAETTAEQNGNGVGNRMSVSRIPYCRATSTRPSYSACDMDTKESPSTEFCTDAEHIRISRRVWPCQRAPRPYLHTEPWSQGWPPARLRVSPGSSWPDALATVHFPLTVEEASADMPVQW